MDKRIIQLIYTSDTDTVLSDLWLDLDSRVSSAELHTNVTWTSRSGTWMEKVPDEHEWTWAKSAVPTQLNAVEKQMRTPPATSGKVRTMDDEDLWASPYRPPSDKQAEICHTHLTSDPSTASSSTEWTFQTNISFNADSRLTLWCLSGLPDGFSLFPPNSSHDSHCCLSSTCLTNNL